MAGWLGGHWAQRMRWQQDGDLDVAAAVKFTPYAARDKQLSAHFHALVNRNKRSVSAKSRGHRPRSSSCCPSRIINYQFYRHPSIWLALVLVLVLLPAVLVAVGLSFWPMELLGAAGRSCHRCNCWRRSSPCRRVGTTAQFQCYKLRRRRLPSTRLVHMAYVQYHGTLKITLIAFCSCCRPGHTPAAQLPGCPTAHPCSCCSPITNSNWYMIGQFDKSTGSWF